VSVTLALPALRPATLTVPTALRTWLLLVVAAERLPALRRRAFPAAPIPAAAVTVRVVAVTFVVASEFPVTAPAAVTVTVPPDVRAPAAAKPTSPAVSRVRLAALAALTAA